MCKTFKNGATKARQLYQNALAIDATCNDAVDGELAQSCLPAASLPAELDLSWARRLGYIVLFFDFGLAQGEPRHV